MEILHQLITFFSSYGYIAVFMVLIACGFGIPIPEDITLVSGGVICGLAAALDVNFMVVVALVGVIIGDGAMFMLGRLLGPRVKKIPGLRQVFTEKSYKKMQEKIHRYGNWILFMARFLPGLRAPIYITAGISRRVSLWKFMFMDGGAALISVPLWVYAGYYFAHDLDSLISWVHHSETFIVCGLALALGAWLISCRLKRQTGSKL